MIYTYTVLLLAHPEVGLQSRWVVSIRIRLDEYNIMQETVRYIIPKQTHKSYFLGLKNKTYRILWPALNEICNDYQDVSKKLFSDMYRYNFLFFFSWLNKAKFEKTFYNFVSICSTKKIGYFYKLEINSHFFVFLEKCTHSLLKYLKPYRLTYSPRSSSPLIFVTYLQLARFMADIIYKPWATCTYIENGYYFVRRL